MAIFYFHKDQYYYNFKTSCWGKYMKLYRYRNYISGEFKTHIKYVVATELKLSGLFSEFFLQ